MKTLENENEKVNRICELLRKETLEPAEKEAIEIIKQAKHQADKIIQEARSQADQIVSIAQSQVAQEKKVFESSLYQGAKQGLEQLRQEIEGKLFHPQLEALVLNHVKQPSVVAQIIDALINGIKQTGISGDLKAYIPKDISKDKINQLLLEETVKQLGSHSVEVGNFEGGAQVKLMNKKMTLDMTDAALKELLIEHVRGDFRKYFFS